MSAPKTVASAIARISVVLAVILPAAGCLGSVSAPIGGARTLEPHENAVGAGVSFGYVPPDNASPQLSFRARTGVSQSFDIGLRGWAGGSFGASIQPRFAVHRAPSSDAGYDVAVAPEVGFHSVWGASGDVIDPTFIPQLTLPVLANLNTPTVDFNVGVYSRNNFPTTYSSADAPFGYSMLAGGVVGLTIPTGPKFRIVPQVSAEYPVYRMEAAVPEVNSDNPSVFVSVGFWGK